MYTKIKRCITLFLLGGTVLTAVSPSPLVTTDSAIFLFDNGERSVIAAMLGWAEQHRADQLASLDFKVIFMGAAVDWMNKPPFCHHPSKLVDYRQLGIQEVVDNTWQRDRLLSPHSLEQLMQNLRIRKGAVLPVSCLFSQQIMQALEASGNVAITVLRDNPLPSGNTDYFKVADLVQAGARAALVPSAAAARHASLVGKQVRLVGHGPTEEWAATASSINRMQLAARLGIDLARPIVLYAGVYVDHYAAYLKRFLNFLADPKVAALHPQLIVAPHPRYRGAVEKKLQEEGLMPHSTRLIGAWEAYPCNVGTQDALALADVIVTADPTSTIVIQANACGKPVALVGPSESAALREGRSLGLLTHVVQAQELATILSARRAETATADVFERLGMPRGGRQLLWEALVDNSNSLFSSPPTFFSGFNFFFKKRGCRLLL